MTDNDWRLRIQGVGSEEAGQLLANPLNWRIHPQEQQDALRGVLSTVGWVDTVKVNVTTGNMLDGHLRVMLAMREHGEDYPVPVTYVELSEQEEALVLASFDLITLKAGTDQQMFAELMEIIDEMEIPEEVSEMLEEMTESIEKETGELDQDQGESEGGASDKLVCCPFCNQTFDARGNEV